MNMRERIPGTAGLKFRYGVLTLLFRVMLFVAAAAFLQSCSMNSTSSDQGVRICPSIHFTNGTQQVSPDSVAKIVITVTFENTTITNSFNFEDHIGTLNTVIPVNTPFIILIEGIDSDDKVIYYGRQMCSGASSDTSIFISASQVSPCAPQNLTAYVFEKTRIALNWKDNASNEDGFILKRSTNNALSYIVLDTIGRNTQQCIDSSAVQPQTVYYYRVMAFNAAGVSDSSETQLDPLEVVPVPAKPSGQTGISLNTGYFYWTDSIACGNGHKVQYQFDWADGSLSDWSFSQTASHAWAAAGNYTVRVRARCAVNKSAISGWSDGLPIVVSYRIAVKNRNARLNYCQKVTGL